MNKSQLNVNSLLKIAIFIVVFLGARKIFDMLLNLFGQRNEDLIKENNNTALELAKDEVNEANLSYSKNQYTHFADGIYTALQSSMSEDEMAVWDIFKKIKNNDDFLQLEISYNVRPIGFYGFRTEMNLSQSIRSLFSANEINTCNYLLRTNGVTKRI